MKSRLPLLTTLALVAIALGAAAIHRLSSAVHLGRPGVRLGILPILDEEGRLARTNSVALPFSLPGWNVAVEPIQRLELNFLPGDTSYGRRRVVSDTRDFEARISVVLMGADRTSIHRPEYCLTGAGWNIARKHTASIRLERPRPADLAVQRFDMTRTLTTERGPIARSGVYVFWFVADGLQTASHYERQWLQIRDLLFRQTLQRWAYVSFFAECAPGREDETFRRLSGLIQAAAPEFQLTAGAGI